MDASLTKPVLDVVQSRLDQVPGVQADNGDLRIGAQSLSIIARRLPSNRRDALRGLLALALLESQGMADPIFVLWVRKLTKGVRSTTTEFFEQFAPQRAWALVDDMGAVLITRPGSPALRHRTPRSSLSARARRGVKKRVALFSDLNRWLIKYLLYLDSPADALGECPLVRPDSAAELARLARVSDATAYRFVQVLEGDRHLGDGFTLRRKHALLTRLFGHQRLVARQFTQYRFKQILPTPLEQLIRRSTHLQIAVGGHLAAEFHGVARTDGRPLLHLNHPIEVLVDDWGLDLVDEGDYDFSVCVHPYTESVFRPVEQIAGLPVVDVLQCGLDMVAHARGGEQAEFIIEHILAAQS